MLEENRNCLEIAQQLHAVEKAVAKPELRGAAKRLPFE